MEAEFAYFKAALKDDQSRIQRASQVPALLKERLHQKVMKHRREQMSAGETALKGYQDRIDWFFSVLGQGLATKVATGLACSS